MTTPNDGVDDGPVRQWFEPPMSEAGGPFWEASREQRLVLPWCPACERPHWYPRDVCPHCLGETIEWREASGKGVVEAASVQHRPALPMFADRVPYVVVLVALDDGVRVMSNVVDTAPDAVVVGARVQASWAPLSDGRHLLLFVLE